MKFTTKKLIIAVMVMGIIAAFTIPFISKPKPVQAEPIMEVDSTVIIIQHANDSL